MNRKQTDTHSSDHEYVEKSKFAIGGGYYDHKSRVTPIEHYQQSTKANGLYSRGYPNKNLRSAYIERQHVPSMLVPRNAPGWLPPPPPSRGVSRASSSINRVQMSPYDNQKKINFLISEQERMRLRKARNLASDKAAALSNLQVKHMTKDVEKPLKSLKGGKSPHRKRHLILGFLFLFGGLIGFSIYQPLVDNILDYVIQLRPGGIFTWAWSYNPIPLHGDFYLIKILNGEDFINGARPQIEELGPFSFLMYRNRRILKWQEDRVEFMESYALNLDYENSLPMSTPIRMLNFPLFGTIAVVKTILQKLYIGFLEPVIKNVIVTALRVSGEEFIDERTAGDIFMGRKIALLDMAESYFLQPLRDRGIPIPEIGLGNFVIRNATFGVMALIGGVEFGPYEAWRTSEDRHLASHFITYRGSSNLPNYLPPCNRVHGSGGIVFGRNLKAKRVEVYNHLGCRTFPMMRKGVEYYNGIRTIRYESDENTFNSSHPRYKCYCFEGNARDCDGWSNGAGCYEGIKIAISFPHFYNSPRRQQAIGGFFNDREMSASFLNIEPNLGVPLNAQIKIQGSLLLEGLNWIPQLSSMADIMYPVFVVKLGLGANWWQSAGALVGINFLVYGSYGILLGGCTVAALQFYKATGRSRSSVGKK